MKTQDVSSLISKLRERPTLSGGDWYDGVDKLLNEAADTLEYFARRETLDNLAGDAQALDPEY